MVHDFEKLLSNLLTLMCPAPNRWTTLVGGPVRFSEVVEEHEATGWSTKLACGVAEPTVSGG